MRTSFHEYNTDLTEDQRRTISGAVMRAAYQAQTFEVAYAFFDYYSGRFGQRIVVMDAAEEAKAREQDRYAETDPASETRVRADVFDMDPARLGALMIHEFSHTGHSHDVAGTGAYQEGHSYAVEYFYAKRSGDADRMERIVRVIASGSVTVASQRAALRQTFKIAYAVLTALRELAVKGRSGRLPALDPPLTDADGDVLIARYIASFSDLGEQLEAIVDHIGRHIDTAYTGPSLEYAPE